MGRHLVSVIGLMLYDTVRSSRYRPDAACSHCIFPLAAVLLAMLFGTATHYISVLLREVPASAGTVT
jgi:hypothetical protein